MVLAIDNLDRRKVSIFWLLLTILAVLVAIFRKDLRYQMFLAAILSIPILLIKPLTNPNFLQIITSRELIIFIAWRLVITTSFAALAVAIYEVFFHKKISPIIHPHRSRLLWLITGLLVLTILLLLHQSLIVAILVALLVDLVIILILRWDLVWDVIFSGFSMGTLYLIIFLITFRGFPGGLNNLWFTNTISGLTLWSLPVEELLAVILFGALIGPLYIAIKIFKKPIEAPCSEITYKKHSKIKIIFDLSLITFSLIVILFGIYYFVIPPKASVLNDSVGVGLLDDISIQFDKPINRDVVSFSISPTTPGQWHFSENIFSKHLFNQAIFTPAKPLKENQKYTIKIANNRNYINTLKGDDSQFSFQTQTLPKIDHASIADKQTDVALNDPINIYLSQKNNKVVDFNFKFEPPVDFTSKISADSMQYELKLNQPLVQGTNYKLLARGWILAGPGNLALDKNWEITFSAKEPPELAGYSPQGNGVLTNIENINLDFAQPMKQDEVDSHILLNPTINGSWQWQTPTKLTYKINEKLSFATTYNILIAKDFHDQKGGFVTDDINVSFSTIGKVKIDNFSPKNGQDNVATDANISVTFNQEVDQISAQRAFSISPNSAGDFSWNGNEMTFIPQGLNKDSTYDISLSPGIKSVNGLDSDETFSSNFSTESSLTILDISIDYQDRSLSCEAAALKMALNYRGIGVSEDDIMARVGFDPTIRNDNIWGDPNNAFVGDINGRQNTTGYGVYWGPIANAANTWRSAAAFSGWSISQIAQAIANDNPVVLWGIYGNGYRDDWQTPDGKNILAWKGEHARTIIGFSGKIDNPTSFTVNDPISGQVTWSADQLSVNMATFGGSGVVVY